VRVDEAGRHAPTLQLNYSRPRSPQALDLGVGSDGGNTIAAHRDRLRDAIVRVERNHMAAEEHQIRWRKDVSRSLRGGGLTLQY
jgi:hypothetical protein